MKKQFDRTKIIIYIISALSLLPILLIALNNHPSADDFSYSMNVRKEFLAGGNIFDIIKQAFLTSKEFMASWQGLYSSAFVLSLQPAAFGEDFYSLTTIILIVSILTSLLLLTSAIWKKVLKSASHDFIVISVLVTFFIVNCIPFPVEGLFWYNGAMNYVFFWTVFLTETSLLIRYTFSDKKESKKIVGIFFLTVLSFILSGGNHVTAFAGLLITAAFLLYTMIRKKRFLLLFPMASGIAGFVWNLTAAGTKVRSDMLAYHGNPIKTMLAACVKHAICVNEWVSFSLILLLVLLTPFLYRTLKTHKGEFSFRILFGMMLLLTVLMLGMWCVPYQALGNFGAGRLRNVIYMTFVLSTVCVYTYFVGILITKWDLENKLQEIKSRCSLREWTSNLLYGALVIGFMGIIMLAGGSKRDYGTTVEAVIELQDAKEYDRQMDMRVETISADTTGIVEVNNITVYPELLFFDDIEVDGGNWKNYNMALYYQKQWIKKAP